MYMFEIYVLERNKTNEIFPFNDNRKEKNRIQINVSINMYTDMTDTIMRIHIRLFIFHPSYPVNETKYKLNMYLDDILMTSIAISIHS